MSKKQQKFDLPADQAADPVSDQAAQKIQGVQLADALRNSAQHIWQAGLGAFVTAREEGSDLFARLLQEGVSLQTRTQQLAGQKISDVISKMTETIGRQAAAPLGKMEEAFEERIARTLRSLGVPTQDDLKALTDGIEDLHKSVKALSVAGARGGKAVAAGKKPAAGATAARKGAAATRSAGTLKKRTRATAESRA